MSRPDSVWSLGHKAVRSGNLHTATYGTIAMTKNILLFIDACKRHGSNNDTALVWYCWNSTPDVLWASLLWKQKIQPPPQKSLPGSSRLIQWGWIPVFLVIQDQPNCKVRQQALGLQHANITWGIQLKHVCHIWRGWSTLWQIMHKSRINDCRTNVTDRLKTLPQICHRLPCNLADVLLISDVKEPWSHPCPWLGLRWNWTQPSYMTIQNGLVVDLTYVAVSSWSLVHR